VLLPLVMFVYALPISVGLPLSFLRQIRDAHDATGRSRLTALSSTILLAWAVCFVSGMHLPRYAYVTIPLLCPIAGAVAWSIPKLGPSLCRLMTAIAGGSTLIFSLVAVAMSAYLWRHSSLRPMLIATGLIALALAVPIVLALFKTGPNWRSLFALPIILFCLSLNVGRITDFDRQHRSSRDQGMMIRFTTGPDAELFTCAMVLDQPELFYYSGLPTHAFDGDNLDWHAIPPGSWVVLEPQELEIWQHDAPTRLRRVIPFVANRNQGYLVWYADAPATTSY
jgi:hypothetical protein